MKRFINTTVGVAYDPTGFAEELAAQDHVEAGTAALPPEERAMARLLTKQRWFMDTDPAGNQYLIPASQRMEWDAWTMAAEESSELPVLPSWARPLKGQVRFVEFERPVEVMQ
ncbi:MAG TPA: hypothetical protein VIL30_05915 [Ramlibacter sp.]|jgi:hypothetical protein